MPYDALGNPVTREELEKEREYVEKHATRIAIANATLPVMATFFFVAGVVGTGNFLIHMIASGVTRDVVLGGIGFAAIVGAGVFGLVNARYEV